MKILYVGNFDGVPYSTENDVRKAFGHLGHEIIQAQENRTSVERLRQFDFDMFLITSTWDDALPLNDMLTFYKECAERKIPTATLHLDTFWGKSRGGRKWWLNPMFHTAYIFTADGDYQTEWLNFGRNHIWLPPAVRHDAAVDGTYRDEYACDVAFVGSNGVGYHEDVWNYRRELVDSLRAMCKRNGWSFKNPGGDDPKIDRDMSMNDFYASAKITVGDSLCLKKEQSQYWSDRVPEAIGRGGRLIMPKIDALSKHFPGIMMYNWGDFEDLENKIRFMLQVEPKDDWSKRMTERARKHDTYVNRAQTILDTICHD